MIQSAIKYFQALLTEEVLFDYYRREVERELSPRVVTAMVLAVRLQVVCRRDVSPKTALIPRLQQ